MTDERAELLHWLNLNKETLKKYDVNEIAHFARQNDFDMSLVFEMVPHWINEQTHKSSYRIREDWFVDRELKCMSPLTESWEHLGRFLTDGYEFHG